MPTRVPIDDLRLDPTNTVTHDDTNRAALLEILRRWDQAIPVVVDSGSHDSAARGVIRKGNLTWTILREDLGKEDVWISWKDFASEADAQAFAAADNRAGELHTWDLAELSAQLGANGQGRDQLG